MENPIPIPSIQTLNPSVTGGRRRRHLASNTFSTLSRIFSHCLAHPTLKDSFLLPIAPPKTQQPRNTTVDVPDSAEEESRKNQSCNAIVDVSTVAGEAGSGDRGGDVAEKAAVGVEDGVDKELLDDLAVDDEMLRSVEKLLNADVSEGEFGDGEDLGLRLLLDEPAKELEIEKIVVGEKNVGEVQQKVDTCFGSPVRNTGDSEEFEDGEIEDEEQVLDDRDMEEQGAVKEGVCKEGDQDHILCTISEVDNVVNLGMRDEMRQTSQCLDPRGRESYSKAVYVSSKGGLLGEDKEKLFIGNEEESLDAKSVADLAKKKRGPLTEERKAKKKIVKKRKRAQKDREQGVKRLKLQPNVKPKQVKICNFYMNGRCQQGDLCKFSHDAVPLTKSQPCKHFACGSCMKGDDCLFDHELSKYPCHNYMSMGMCTRGDTCKFSHKISTADASSASKIGVPFSPLSSGKRLDTKSTSIFDSGLPKGSCLATNDPSIGTKRNTPFSSTKHLETNSVKVQKKPLAVPKGIRFLSFGKGPAESSNSQGKMQMEKNGSGKISNQEKQDGGAVCHPARTVVGNKNPKSNSSGHIVVPFSKSLKSEASDSLKILDEFLFGAVI